jgi:2-amino-4-hydroxy-6-hydroxymethyldihydropteridine diphosphokinase
MGFVGGKFLNGAVLYRIPEGPDPEQQARELLATVKRIEREMGRIDPPEYDGAGNRIYHSRIIDIDILLFGDLQMDTEELTIPHPLMNERDFVLNPLKEIMPADRQSTAASAIPDKT